MTGQESPEYVRVSHAAAMTMGLAEGRFFRDAKLYCLNLLLTYSEGCVGKCAYCGLSGARENSKNWNQQSFIRVDWPTISLNEIIKRMDNESCSHIERVCVSMVTNIRAKEDTLKIVKQLRKKTDAISTLVAPTIINKDWLLKLKDAGSDKIGVAVDAVTPELFDKFRGKGVNGPHKWEYYWKIVKEAVEVFGKYNVGTHLIVGLGESEEQMIQAIQNSYDLGATTHLFSFFAEEESQMQEIPQPPIGQYRRVQLARYLINKGKININQISFTNGKVTEYNIPKEILNDIIDSGLPFMTSGCASKTKDNACNRPFGDYTPYQAYMGEMRNYPFTPNSEDVAVVRKQLKDYSDVPVKEWAEGLGCNNCINCLS